MRSQVTRWHRIPLPGVCPVTFRSSHNRDQSIPGYGFALRGGPGPHSPWRALPGNLALNFDESGDIVAVRVRGLFGLFGSSDSADCPALAIHVFQGSQLIERFELFTGRHLVDPSELDEVSESHGDGISLNSMGRVQVGDKEYRIDEITLERLRPGQATRFELVSENGRTASVIFQVEVGEVAAVGCPFHSDAGGIPLAELGAIIRNRDRALLRRALDQLRSGLESAQDLDEARGQALTFLAVITAATLELGATRNMHKVQLEAARSFDRLEDRARIADEAEACVRRVVDPLLSQDLDPSRQWVEKALIWIDRHYAQEFTDADVAKLVGLSRSHFRFLFQEVTGQPFHRFVVSKRLEKAHNLIVDQGLSVGEAASAVGFGSTSHFSRAFSKRFKVSPNQLRKGSI